MEALANQLDELHLTNDKAIQKALDPDGKNFIKAFLNQNNIFYFVRKNILLMRALQV